MGIRVVADDGGIKDQLVRLSSTQNFGNKKLMQDIGEKWVSNIRRQFIFGKEPNGTEWQGIAKRTEEVREDKGFSSNTPPLTMSGSLGNSFGAVVTNKRVVIQSSMNAIAVKHQFGDVPASESPFGRIPARQILPETGDLPPSWNNDVNNAFEELFNGVLKK